MSIKTATYFAIISSQTGIVKVFTDFLMYRGCKQCQWVSWDTAFSIGITVLQMEGKWEAVFLQVVFKGDINIDFSRT